MSAFREVILQALHARLQNHPRLSPIVTQPSTPGGSSAAAGSKTGRGQISAPIFLLVPQLNLPKGLDLVRDTDRAHDAVPELIVEDWMDGHVRQVGSTFCYGARRCERRVRRLRIAPPPAPK